MINLTLFHLFNPHYCNCHTGRIKQEQAEWRCVHCSRQCNQTEPAITQKVDLTTGHLLKLKTRHLHCTYSLGNITPIGSDWLSGELVPYKRWSFSVVDTIDWRHPPISTIHHSSSTVVLRWVVKNFTVQACFFSYEFIHESELVVLTWCWIVCAGLGEICKNETGHPLPLSGEHSLGRTCTFYHRKIDRGCSHISISSILGEVLMFPWCKFSCFCLHFQSFFHYLPHYAGSRQPSSQVNMLLVNILHGRFFFFLCRNDTFT